jgi:outer membrane protein assembly complex protein YaeT
MSAPGCSRTWAQAPGVSGFEGRNIESIEYIPDSFLDAMDLARAQPLKTGQPLHIDMVSQAIDSLFATGQFADIAVEGDLAGAGVRLRFIVQPQKFVAGIQTSGKIKAPPSSGELHSFTQISLGQSFEEKDIGAAVTSLHNLMERNGFYGAKIEPKVAQSPDGQQVFITFAFNELKRAKYEHPVIQGETLLSDDAILRATGWRIPVIHWWRQVTQARTNSGVQGLLSKYQKQDRLTANVDLTKVEYDEATQRVRPHLDVTPGPKIKVRTLEAKVSGRVMRRYVPIYQERAVDPDLLLEGKQNLEDYFQGQGYYDVDIEFRVQPPVNGVETIDYVISLGVRRKVVKVNIAGNRYFDSEVLRERMFIQPAALNLRHGRYSEAFRRKDEENIAELYRASGFRDVQVSTRVDDDYKGKSGEVAVTMTITEGHQWLVNQVNISGVSQVPEEQLRGLLASTSGQPFSEVNLAGDRSVVLTHYFEQGFPAAQLNARWRQSGPYAVDVDYSVTEGERQYVREVITAGTHTTRQRLVEEQITLKPGDPLSPVEQSNIQKSLYDLGIFARVDTAIENPDGSAAHKYVLYNFEESNRYVLNVGLGAQIGRFGTPDTTSLSSPGGATGFSPSISLDITRLNFLGLGHTVTLKTIYSSLEKEASLTYLQPRVGGLKGRNLTYSLLYDDTRDVRTFASKREEAGIQLSQVFSKSLTGLFRFAYRRVSVSDVVIPVLLIPQFVQPERIGMLSAGLIQDRRDNKLDPTRGVYNTIDVGLSTKWFGSQRSFVRLLARNATYYKLSRSVILARQTQFGVILPFAVASDIIPDQSIPLPERFYGGGADSLRSFPYNQAGPRDTGAPLAPGGPSSEPTGFPLGGNALLFNNVELRFPLLGENVRGVLFHDIGNVYTALDNISLRFHQRSMEDFNYATQAVGFGIRYRTPVGPIRVDLAYAINPPHFIGFSGTPTELLNCNPNLPPSSNPSYCQPTPQSISHFQFFFSIGQTF